MEVGHQEKNNGKALKSSSSAVMKKELALHCTVYAVMGRNLNLSNYS